MSAKTFPIQMDNGTGYVRTDEVSAILPVADKRKKDCSFLIADCLPEGIEVKGTPDALHAEWTLRLLALDMDEDDWHELSADQEEDDE